MKEKLQSILIHTKHLTQAYYERMSKPEFKASYNKQVILANNFIAAVHRIQMAIEAGVLDSEDSGGAFVSRLMDSYELKKSQLATETHEEFEKYAVGEIDKLGKAVEEFEVKGAK